jgi:glutamate-1-semialdehyde 2,1-aminomutase
MTLDPQHRQAHNGSSAGAPSVAKEEATGAKSRSIDPDVVAELTEQQSALLDERTPRSKELFEQGKQVLPAGVPSQFQARDPWPIFIDHGKGAHVWDVDGNEYADFHNAFGVMCVGHANPKIVAAVQKQIERGSHFAAPTHHAAEVAEELRRRWGLPYWRFTNSGTEATLDAIHLARGSTGRDIIIKTEGTYHGHHDAVMVSVKPPLEELGPRDHPNRVQAGLGLPKALTELTHLVPFNDADALEVALNELKGKVAGVIIDPAMMNVNIIKPLPGYLERLRELTLEHDVRLIFDEVKTGATIASGGAVEEFGVTPDIVCLAKATAGGLPGGSVGMNDELGALVASGKIRQQGTFNGNPLVMAAAKAALIEVLTDEAYAKFERANDYLMSECQRVIDRYQLPAHPIGIRSKGCVIFSTEPIVEYRDYVTKIDHSLSSLAWLYHLNHGIFMSPGSEEQWTLSVAHDDEMLQRYVAAFESFAKDLTGH